MNNLTYLVFMFGLFLSIFWHCHCITHKTAFHIIFVILIITEISQTTNDNIPSPKNSVLPLTKPKEKVAAYPKFTVALFICKDVS